MRLTWLLLLIGAAIALNTFVFVGWGAPQPLEDDRGGTDGGWASDTRLHGDIDFPAAGDAAPLAAQPARASLELLCVDRANVDGGCHQQ
jgi:hypothetical protein